MTTTHSSLHVGYIWATIPSFQKWQKPGFSRERYKNERNKGLGFTKRNRIYLSQHNLPLRTKSCIIQLYIFLVEPVLDLRFDPAIACQRKIGSKITYYLYDRHRLLCGNGVVVQRYGRAIFVVQTIRWCGLIVVYRVDLIKSEVYLTIP